MSHAAVVDLEFEREKRAARPGAFVAVFYDHINDLADRMQMHHNEWRALYYCIPRCTYGQSLPFTGRRGLAQALKITPGTAGRILKRFLAWGIVYEHNRWLYLSAYVAYKGKLNALARVRQWEDLIKAAAHRGEVVDVDIGEEHYYAGGQEIDDDSPTLPDWLEDA